MRLVESEQLILQQAEAAFDLVNVKEAIRYLATVNNRRGKVFLV